MVNEFLKVGDVFDVGTVDLEKTDVALQTVLRLETFLIVKFVVIEKELFS